MTNKNITVKFRSRSKMTKFKSKVNFIPFPMIKRELQ